MVVLEEKNRTLESLFTLIDKFGEGKHWYYVFSEGKGALTNQDMDIFLKAEPHIIANISREEEFLKTNEGLCRVSEYLRLEDDCYPYNLDEKEEVVKKTKKEFFNLGKENLVLLVHPGLVNKPDNRFSDIFLTSSRDGELGSAFYLNGRGGEATVIKKGLLEYLKENFSSGELYLNPKNNLVYCIGEEVEWAMKPLIDKIHIQIF